MTTVCSEDVELDDVCRRLEEDYQRHTDLLTQLIDQGTETGRDEFVARQLMASSRQALAQIARAVRAIVEGTYGVCVRCAQRIPAERLRVLPHAAYCLPCAKQPHHPGTAPTMSDSMINRHLEGRASPVPTRLRRTLPRAS